MTKKILIIDDCEITLKLTQKFLMNYGYDVDIAENSSKALEYINNPAYDLVLSEVNMEGLSGFDLLKLMRRYIINIPVVFLTSDDDATTVEEALNQGAIKVISKKREYINLPHIINTILYDYYKQAG